MTDQMKLGMLLTVVTVTSYLLSQYGYDHALSGLARNTIIGCTAGRFMVEIEECGGFGDGVTDNTEAFDRAMSLTGPVTIYFKPGMYVFGRNVFWSLK